MNMTTDKAVDRDGGVLDYCRLNDITIQTWSPLHYGFMNGIYVGNNKKYKKLNEKLEEIASKRRVTSTTIAIAWILHHPAGMQVIVGTMNESRLDEICQAHYVQLSRKEWYEIYQAAGNLIP
jgi:predicted oxidoreductase